MVTASIALSRPTRTDGSPFTPAVFNADRALSMAVATEGVLPAEGGGITGDLPVAGALLGAGGSAPALTLQELVLRGPQALRSLNGIGVIAEREITITRRATIHPSGSAYRINLSLEALLSDVPAELGAPYWLAFPSKVSCTAPVEIIGAHFAGATTWPSNGAYNLAFGAAPRANLNLSLGRVPACTQAQYDAGDPASYITLTARLLLVSAGV